jgi:phosphoglycolate phosphatase
MPIRTMIFDFDGTIADTYETVIGVLIELADEFGYRRAPREELPELGGLRPRDLAERIGLPWHKMPLLVVRVRKEMASRMGSVQPCRGVPEARAQLRARGTKLGMLTSNNRANVDAFFARNPSLPLDFISAGSGLFSKHTRLRRLLAKHRLALAETCYVGDEVRDIEAARELGMRMVAVGWGFSSPQLLAAESPEHLLSDPAELVALV